MKIAKNTYVEIAVTKMARVAAKMYMATGAGRRFMAKYITAVQKGTGKRKQYEEQGIHVPSFLFASVSTTGGGLYADSQPQGSDAPEMTADEWRSMFEQASSLGVVMILMSGREPLTRRDVLAVAGEYPQIFFTAVIDSALMDDNAIDFCAAHPNIRPVLNVDGGNANPEDVFAPYRQVTAILKKKKIPFGASITATNQNIDLMVDHTLATEMRKNGCILISFVGYMPLAGAGNDSLKPNKAELARLDAYVERLKEEFLDIIIMQFPHDVVPMGGSHSDQRGFLSINARGKMETYPQPETMVSLDMNVRNTSLLDAIQAFDV